MYDGEKTFFYLLLIALIVVAGLRYRIGIDTIRYSNAFETIPTLSDITFLDFQETKMDPLCFLFWSLVRSISSEFWVMQFAQAIFVNCVFFRFIKNNTEKIYFGVFLYICFLYLNFMCEVMREACAVSISLLGWEYLKKKKYFVFFTFIIIASGFHSSALVLLVIPLLFKLKLWNNMKVGKKSIAIIFIVGIIGFVVQNQFFSYIQMLNISSKMNEKAMYYENSIYTENGLNIIGLSSMIIKNIIFPSIVVYSLKMMKQLKYPEIEGMVVMFFIFSVLTFPIAIFYRYENYFMPFVIIVLSDIAYSRNIFILKKSYLIKSAIGWYMFFIPLMFLRFYVYWGNAGATKFKQYEIYYPYSTIISKELSQNREMIYWSYGIN